MRNPVAQLVHIAQISDQAVYRGPESAQFLPRRRVQGQQNEGTNEEQQCEREQELHGADLLLPSMNPPLLPPDKVGSARGYAISRIRIRTSAAM
jgi:hypothetical protein